jgi:hypothetical protein
MMAGGAIFLAGCASPKAQLSTYQDAKFPVDRQSKIAFSAEPPDDLAARQATEYLREQMQAMNFNLVAPADADFTVQCAETTTSNVVPTGSGASVGVGGGSGFGTGGGGGVFTGLGVSFPIGGERTTTKQTTQLKITLETAHDPPVQVWQADITAETPDETKYRENFYRWPFFHLGENFDGAVNLDELPASKSGE